MKVKPDQMEDLTDVRTRRRVVVGLGGGSLQRFEGFLAGELQLMMGRPLDVLVLKQVLDGFSDVHFYLLDFTTSDLTFQYY